MKGHIVRRGKQSWRLKYERGTDPLSGKRVTEYRTFRGTKRDAQAELVRLINSVHQGEHIDASKLTVAEYFDSVRPAGPPPRSGRRRVSVISSC
jgi:hypothetical protein